MAQLFRPGADTVMRVALVCAVLLPFAGVALAYAVRNTPYVTEQAVTIEQPVPFSHKHHVGDLGLDCRYCHEGVTNSRFADMPPTSTCMTCHSQIWTNAAMLAPVRESLAKDRPLLWRRVNNLPDYVYFDHSIHIAKGVGCSSCHGDVKQMALTKQAQPLTMGWCLSCHRDPGKNLRPPDQIFDTSIFPHNDAAEGARLVRFYHVRTEGLTDCSTCHR